MTRRPVSVAALGRFCAVLIGAWWAGGASIVSAQGSTATIEVRVQVPGAASAPVSVQLGSLTSSSQSWSADVRSGEGVRFRLLLPGRYRLVAGGVERQLDVRAGDALTVDVTGASGGGNDVRVARTDRTA